MTNNCEYIFVKGTRKGEKCNTKTQKFFCSRHDKHVKHVINVWEEYKKVYDNDIEDDIYRNDEESNELLNEIMDNYIEKMNYKDCVEYLRCSPNKNSFDENWGCHYTYRTWYKVKDVENPNHKFKITKIHWSLWVDIYEIIDKEEQKKYKYD